MAKILWFIFVISYLVEMILKVKENVGNNPIRLDSILIYKERKMYCEFLYLLHSFFENVVVEWNVWTILLNMKLVKLELIEVHNSNKSIQMVLPINSFIDINFFFLFVLAWNGKPIFLFALKSTHLVENTTCVNITII